MQLMNSVIIVGSGSAGWLAALALSTYCPFLDIRLVRPRRNVPIGVGESTQPDFIQLLRAAGIDIADFYTACEATMKCGIFYTDWNTLGDHYWHPFSDLALTGSYSAAHHYQQLALSDPQRYPHEHYYAAVHTSYEACVRQKRVAPEAAAAFHVDAKKITEYLQRKLAKVQVLEFDDIEVQTSAGKVSALVLDGGNILSADLYVDCTGFSRGIIKHVSKLELHPYEANVNRAVVAQVPYADLRKELTPYTGAHAHEHGWTWAIPLKTRIGSGYVYHKDFCSADQAETNFRNLWGEARMRDVNVGHVPFDSCPLRHPWVENVVTIGLSAGFVEPLEATGLNWTITSATLLCQSLATRYHDHYTSARYNANMLGYVFDVHDFIDAHYKLSARRDSEFWRYQSSRTFPDRLEMKLELFAREMPNDLNRVKNGPWAFNEVSWLDILNGYHFKYQKLNVHPAQVMRAQRTLQEIATMPRQSLDPATCLPPQAQQASLLRA
jgi:tryptophan halogenase